MRKLGIDARSRIVDPSQYKAREESFDFDIVSAAFGGAPTPGVELLRLLQLGGRRPAGLAGNMGGVADPVVDALIEKIAAATSRSYELNVACRVLDRVLRAGHYWVPMWYRDEELLAYWDAFSRPERQPRFWHGATGHLVVGRRKGEKNWASSRAFIGVAGLIATARCAPSLEQRGERAPPAARSMRARP